MLIDEVLSANKPGVFKPDVTKPDSPKSAYLQFKIFSFLWAVAILFHMAHSGIYDTKLIYALLSLSAIFVMFRPGNFIGFMVLVSLQLYDFVDLMPRVVNHAIIAGFVNFTIVQALLYLIIKHRSFRINKGEWLQIFAPAIRMEVIIVYFYAVFHKLNSSFLSPDVSCATILLKAQRLPSIIPLTPDLIAFNGYFTLIVEAAIPILLSFKKTRHWGILLGVVFHSILSYSSFNGFFDFSSMIFALYFLFASPQLSIYITDILEKTKTRGSFASIKSSFSFTKLALIIGVTLVGLSGIHILNKKLSNFDEFHRYFFWAAYSCLYLLFLVGFLFTKKHESKETKLFSLPNWSFWIFPIIVFLNGLSPYIGLKTDNSYSMFSNLRTEGGISNHYIVPVKAQIFNFQKDLVEIVSSSDKNLQKEADSNNLLVFFNFKDYIAMKRPERVEYIRKGVSKTFILNNPSTHEDLLQRNNVLLRKIFNFRAINKYEPQPCNH